MSATVVAATSAAGIAAAASARARKAECAAITDNYQAQTATIEQARDYASCIRTLHGTGEPLDPIAAMALKAVIVLSLVAAVVGGMKNYEEGWAKAAVFSLLGAAAVWIGAVVLVAVGVGLRFVIS